MRFKFNGGLGAYLCDNCSKIMWTSSDVPTEYKKLSVQELASKYILCEDCSLETTPKKIL